jgi:hypothetical protein
MYDAVPEGRLLDIAVVLGDERPHLATALDLRLVEGSVTTCPAFACRRGGSDALRLRRTTDGLRLRSALSGFHACHGYLLRGGTHRKPVARTT